MGADSSLRAALLTMVSAALAACAYPPQPPAPPEAAADTPETAPDPMPAKMTPDTALDYRPDLELWWATMPDGKPENLMALLEALATLHPRLATEAGHWTDGDITVGAEPREYVPSDAELVAAELCLRIKQAVEAGDARAIADEFRGTVFEGAEIERQTFRFRHADVYHMGRYFFSTPAETCKVTLPK